LLACFVVFVTASVCLGVYLVDGCVAGCECG
jgi:hypothetical protein